MALPLRVEGDGVDFVFMSFEGSEKFGVFLLFDHQINLNY
jgi:hypothetical protein